MVQSSKDRALEIPLAFVSNTFLDELTTSLRVRSIPWEVLAPQLLSPNTLPPKAVGS